MYISAFMRCASEQVFNQVKIVCKPIIRVVKLILGVVKLIILIVNKMRREGFPTHMVNLKNLFLYF